MPHPILLYDGVCGLCNRLVQFILKRDPDRLFRFAALQSVLAGRTLARHGVDAQDLDTVYVVVDYGLRDEELLARSDAVLFILRHLGAAELRSARPRLRPEPTQPKPTPGPRQTTHRPTRWRLAGFLLQLLPRPVRDWGYRVVARHRYRIFGRYDTCPIPSAETRARFLDE